MMQGAIMAQALLTHHQGAPPRTILDLGSGDGTLMLRAVRKLARRWPGVTVVMLDRQDIVSAQTRDEFKALQWQ